MRRASILGASLRLGSVGAALVLSGCAATGVGALAQRPVIAQTTDSQRTLRDLPRPSAPTTIAVYQFADQTGQFKLTESQQQSLSRALTQGADSLLVQALADAGSGGWFNVVERGRLSDLLQERRLIAATRQDYLGETKVNSDVLPPLLFASAIVQGGVIGYDTNVMTGGMGARFLGIGGSTQYRESIITVALRLVSVKNGQILANVTARKVVVSVGVQGGLNRYIAFKRLLEVEGGVTANEPSLIALQQAIEQGVAGLIVKGARARLWAFADREAGERAMADFERENTGLGTGPGGDTIDISASPPPVEPPRRAVEGCRRAACPESEPRVAPTAPPR